MSRSVSRRGFLADVGRGALVASVGSTVAADLGLASAAETPVAERLTFGALEPLVCLMQDCAPAKLVATIVEKHRAGAPLRDLVAAAAMANARTFGGEDYVGFHTMMALAPAFHMSQELPAARQALPILKVLHRNTSRIHEYGGKAKEVLHPVSPPAGKGGPLSGETLREVVRSRDLNAAESTFARIAQGSADDAFNAVLFAVDDNTEVHRTVLPYRAWDLMGIIGREQAHTLLRQSVRYCVMSERNWSHSAEIDRPRTILPQLMDQYQLAGRKPGHRTLDDAEFERQSLAIFSGTPEHAAEIAAGLLADGVSPDMIGEAITLAANQLLLRDEGRTGSQVIPGKPAGSVHGDSIGVHACDSANAWRNMARVSNTRNTFACLILGAYQVALDRGNRGGDFLKWTPRPRPEDLETVRSSDPVALLRELDAAIRANEQSHACAITQKLVQLGSDPEPVFATLLGYAVSEDGALHAEKFYRTVREEYRSTRPAFRGRHLVALARVTASEYGKRAAGYDEACELVNV